MRYTETNEQGFVQRELTFEGAEEALLAFRGALFSKDVLLIDRVKEQMNHVLDECSDTERNIYREEGLFFIDSDAKLILDGLRKQVTPVHSLEEAEYVHPHRSAQIRLMLEHAGVCIEEVSSRVSLAEQLKRLIPRPRIAVAEVAA